MCRHQIHRKRCIRWVLQVTELSNLSHDDSMFGSDSEGDKMGSDSEYSEREGLTQPEVLLI